MYLLFFILNIIDIFTTYLILGPNPDDIVEFNPVMDTLINSGWFNFVAIKIVVSLVIIVVLYATSKEDAAKAKFGLHLIIFMYVLIVLNNSAYLLAR